MPATQGALLTTVVPFARSYWVRPSLFLAGAYPGSPDRKTADAKLLGLIRAGIRHVVNLMEPDETNWDGTNFTPYADRLIELGKQQGATMSMTRHPIPDQHIPNRELMIAILDDIDRSLEAQAPVFVHCWGGKGRTGTVVGCHLARHGIASGNEALKRIAILRRNDPKAHEPAPENELQCNFVRSWKEGV